MALPPYRQSTHSHFAGFLLYGFVSMALGLSLIYILAPRYGRTNPLIYVSICSIFGSLSIMAVKGLGIAVKLTFAGDNQFSHPSTYVFGAVVVSCILVQMNYFNKALDTFSTNVYVPPSPVLEATHVLTTRSVNTMYYVGFSSCTILASLILFQGFYDTSTPNTISLFVGFLIIFLGVHLLEHSRAPDALPPGHSSLEAGLMNPRLSISGRMSLDGWSPVSPGQVPLSATRHHGRRGSRGASRSQVLFNAFEDELPPANAGLARLPEATDEDDDDEDEDEDDTNEQTRLRSSKQQSQARSPRGMAPRGNR
jgi:hypothetical protein